VKTRVLIIDDSALVRSLLTEIVNRQPDLEAIGAAPDPLVAREMIRALNPDVLTLDIEMPKMDGLVFLERLMRLRPTPVVMVSTLTERGAEVTFKDAHEAIATVNANGDVTVVYHALARNVNEIASQTSHDGGNTFDPSVSIGPFASQEVTGMRTGNGLAAAAVDPVTGRLYVTWPDQTLRQDALHDIVVAVSSDGAGSWAGPRIVDSLEILAHIIHPEMISAPQLPGAFRKLRVSEHDFA